MLIKEKDHNQQQADYLSDLLERDLPASQKHQIERELSYIQTGDANKKNANYYIDIDFNDAKNWAVIHDLQFEHEGNIAQIDHLLIGRLLDIFVIESKNFLSGLSISDNGDFSYLNKDQSYSISSPIEENEKNIQVLNQYLIDNDLYPKRLGVPLKPTYRNIVLISPDETLIKPKKGLYDCSAVMAVDKLINHIKNDLDDEPVNSLISITKVMSMETLRGFAEKLACIHKPKEIDYELKFFVDFQKTGFEFESPFCPKCNKIMVKREVKKGKDKGKMFWGCSQYPKCKGTLDIKHLTDEKKTIESGNIKEPVCPDCGKPMLRRVATKGHKKGCEFWGCSGFPKCKATLELEKENEKSTPIIDKNAPAVLKCPKCHQPMVKRSSKKGEKVGTKFWGCSSFPKCRTVIAID